MKRLVLSVLALALCFSMLNIVDSKAEGIESMIGDLDDDTIRWMYYYLEKEMEARGLEKISEPLIMPWYDSGVGQYLPNFYDATGRKPSNLANITNTDSSFIFQTRNVTEEDYYSYIIALGGWGYLYDSVVTETSFTATSDYGIEVNVSYGYGGINIIASYIN